MTAQDQHNECKNCDKKDCNAKERQKNESDEQFHDRQLMSERLCRIEHKLLVLSGKGGVGKSTVAVNLAVSLSLMNRQVGLMDIDIHGPSVPKLLNLEGHRISGSEDGIHPIDFSQHLKVMSVAFFLPRTDDAVIWRGPMKYSLIKQFIRDVAWGDLDYLIVDSPPGTGDEPLAVAQLIGKVDGAVIVTTPQEIALHDVRKSIEFCRVLKIPVLGVIENMSGFTCPHCGGHVDIFSQGGGKTMAEQMMVPFLGSIPLDQNIVSSSDNGIPYVVQYTGSTTAQAFARSIQPMILRLEGTPEMGDDRV